ncbi:hypothetical protein SAMN05444422_105216 [Halobiforma haloterrestris]|uniref:Uncharacterized protein n=1 Tax=Natronobacterium haloterrestre TaxID=148448 RepID=A0A1I1H738_NATHA|nr:hypothetical protein [Halobiforma haloterrestris]SFC19392.1 hypothetical protein SAMN05444422_105216 [Halobiforma haloterrestris]
MRLTPSWLRSSSDTSRGECRGDETSTEPEVAVYHDPKGEFSSEARDAGEFVPDSDEELLAVLEGMQMPATVDEVTDRLVEPAQPPIDTWAAVHERLHRTRLPALDASGDIEFDDAQGIVDRSRSRAAGRNPFSPAVFGTLSIVALFVAIALVWASVLTAVTVLLVTTTFAAWLV